MKTCELCKQEFECGANDPSGRCWCFDMKGLKPIPSSIQDCLCPSCLEKFRASTTKTVATLTADTATGTPRAQAQAPPPPRPAATAMSTQPPADLAEGRDFYFNDKGQMVFTAHYHLERGYCCQNDCLHCPYTGTSR